MPFRARFWDKGTYGCCSFVPTVAGIGYNTVPVDADSRHHETGMP